MIQVMKISELEMKVKNFLNQISFDFFTHYQSLLSNINNNIFL